MNEAPDIVVNLHGRTLSEVKESALSLLSTIQFSVFKDPRKKRVYVMAEERFSLDHFIKEFFSNDTSGLNQDDFVFTSNVTKLEAKEKLTRSIPTCALWVCLVIVIMELIDRLNLLSSGL